MDHHDHTDRQTNNHNAKHHKPVHHSRCCCSGELKPISNWWTRFSSYLDASSMLHGPPNLFVMIFLFSFLQNYFIFFRAWEQCWTKFSLQMFSITNHAQTLVVSKLFWLVQWNGSLLAARQAGWNVFPGPDHYYSTPLDVVSIWQGDL